MLLTSMISYKDNGLFLELSASSEANRKALEATKLFCVTQLDKVKIQFILRSVQRAETNGVPAFFAPLPDSVLRLQRREYYRLAAPIARPLKCVIPFPTATGERRAIDVHVVDISGGGLGVISIPLDIPLERGLELPCKVELPEVGLVTGTIVVRSVFESVTRTGVKSKRAGCEFVKLPGSMLTLIQRYIIKVERERKARESGLG
jgi:c-di-GMP-binding flagellar brake protein YcgR